MRRLARRQERQAGVDHGRHGIVLQGAGPLRWREVMDRSSWIVLSVIVVGWALVVSQALAQPAPPVCPPCPPCAAATGPFRAVHG